MPIPNYPIRFRQIPLTATAHHRRRQRARLRPRSRRYDARSAQRRTHQRHRSAPATRVIDVDTVVFAIGDKVDNDFGLPVEWNEYVKSKAPQFPIDDMSYEAFDPVTGQTIDGVFVAGWARSASDGLVGAARKDGENRAKALLAYLETKEAGGVSAESIGETIRANVASVVDKVALDRLEAVEESPRWPTVSKSSNTAPTKICSP